MDISLESPLARADVYSRLKKPSPISIVTDLCAALVDEREALAREMVLGASLPAEQLRGLAFAHQRLYHCEQRFERIIEDFNKKSSIESED